MSYGGVSRPVILEQVPEIYLRSLFITPRKTEQGWQAALKAVLENLTDEPQTAELVLTAVGENCRIPDITVPAHAVAEAEAALSFREVSEWSCESPKLYTAEAVLLRGGIPVGDLIDRFGFREITVSGKDILLNGKKAAYQGRLPS